MKNRTVLQVPMEKKLREKATNAAKQYGFSSLQEAVRVILKQFSEKKPPITLSADKPSPVKLSKEASRRYAKAIERIERGEGITKTNSLQELFDLLRI